ncbi:MAG: hypothetical protein ACKVJC_04835, partial [Flavobacteriales bacterium]
PKYTIKKGMLLMIIGIVVVFIGTRFFVQDANFGMSLLPFTLIIFGVLLFFGGFSNSKVERIVLGGADNGIKYVRDNWFIIGVSNIVGTKLKWYRAGFLFPLIFTIGIIAMTVSGIIGTTFFPDIQPDFFTIEAVYKPGDSKSKSEEFITSATKILFEENDRIIEETGDSLLTYFSSNIGFAMNIGQGGNHASMLQVFFNGENSETPVDTLMNRIIRRLDETDNGKLAQNTYVGGFNRFGKEIEIGITSSNDVSLSNARDLLGGQLQNMEGVFNIKDNMPMGKNEVYLTIRPEAEIYGLNQSEVLRQVRAGFFGQEAQRGNSCFFARNL